MQNRQLLQKSTRLLSTSVNALRFAHFESLKSSAPPNLVLPEIDQQYPSNEDQANIVPNPQECTNVVRHCNNSIPKHKVSMMKWVDDFSSPVPTYAAVAEINPRLFDVQPKLDLLNKVVQWQLAYREVDYAWTRTRAEIGRGKKKPWPQKGTGRKRQGATNTTLWKKGGICHGPRGPDSLYYELDDEILVNGLLMALTIKSLQNDLIIASPMECLNEEGSFSEVLINRGLDSSTALLIHGDYESPSALGNALEKDQFRSLMPLCGLNVYSILKHDKLILSMEVLDELEDKLVWQLDRYPWHINPHNFYKDLPGRKYAQDDVFIGSDFAKKTF